MGSAVSSRMEPYKQVRLPAVYAAHVSLQLMMTLQETYYPVHSLYNSGFNIKVGRFLCFVGNKENELLPFGIGLKTGDYEMLRSSGLSRQALLRWDREAGNLIWEGGSICLNSALVFDSRYHPVHDLSAPGVRNALKLLGPIARCSSNASDLGITRLYQAYASGNEDGIRESVRHYIGRGPGLTPSGDDMLLGMLFIDMACFGNQGILKRILLSELHEGMTTDAAMSNYQAALDGLYCGSFLYFIEACAKNSEKEMRNAVLSIRRFGHSSGEDMIFGLFFQLKQLELKV